MSALTASYEAGSGRRDADPPAGDYYVTCRRSGWTGHAFLLGPYADLRDALAERPRAIALTVNRDPTRGPWYLYGTARAAIGTPILTIFGR